MSTLQTIIIVAVLSGIARFGIRYYFFMHYERYDVITRHAPGPCVELDGADGGSEDLTILPSGLTFISSGIYPNKQGRILLLDMNELSPTVREAKIIGAKLDMATFSPHGISTWTNPDTGEITLMVINHVQEERVEVFRYRSGSKSLVHLKSITSPLWGSINDLAMVGEDSFYVTQILHSSRPLLRKLEHRLMLSLGEVMFYDGASVRSVASGLHVPNGINKSPDGKVLYVANGGAYQLKSYEILDNNDIKFIEVCFTGLISRHYYGQHRGGQTDRRLVDRLSSSLPPDHCTRRSVRKYHDSVTGPEGSDLWWSFYRCGGSIHGSWNKNDGFHCGFYIQWTNVSWHISNTTRPL
ncbi:serum paraoxonase/arylesterase 1-like isoform X2 [Argopecten irradians]|uniref:serum paraoxonase/arylesterase 1-like isoform X2 n=1 Tax=Argopecten irradians TaxID=31199 RepID=UPI003718BA93